MTNNIDDILNHYFEGISTAGEDKILKDYFRGHQVSPQHEMYKPLFDQFDQERESMIAPRFVIPTAGEKGKRRALRSLWIASAGVAAVLLLCILLLPFKDARDTQQEYVVIVNGKKISDPQKAKEYAEAMFTQVCAIKNEHYQSLGKAKEMQEMYNAAKIIGEAKKGTYLLTTRN